MTQLNTSSSHVHYSFFSRILNENFYIFILYIYFYIYKKCRPHLKCKKKMKKHGRRWCTLEEGRGGRQGKLRIREFAKMPLSILSPPPSFHLCSWYMKSHSNNMFYSRVEGVVDKVSRELFLFSKALILILSNVQNYFQSNIWF